MEVLILFLILFSPLLFFILYLNINWVLTQLELNKKYKFFFKKIDDMIFYYDRKNIISSNINFYDLSYDKNQWKVYLRDFSSNYIIDYGINPFKNYWYNKIVNKINNKNIYSYNDYIYNYNKISLIEKRSKKLDELLK